MTAPERVLVQLPVGQPIDLFAAVGSLLDAAIVGVMMGPGMSPEVAAQVLLPEGLTPRDAAERLRQAAAQVDGTDYVPLDHDPDDLDLTVGQVRKHEDGGISIGIGGPMDVAQRAAQATIDAFIPALDESGATNYLEFDATVRATGARLCLIVCRHDGKSPHKLRQEAEAERDQALAQVAAVRALCADAMKLPTADDPRPADDRVSPRAVLAALNGATQ